jgi:hypothetical protein
MYNSDGKLVWSQACIAIMERSPEYMELLSKARDVLQLPPGEWMFPPPVQEPHYSKFYGHQDILKTPSSSAVENLFNGEASQQQQLKIPLPDDFVAQHAGLYYTTPGTVEGVGQWKELTRINLLAPRKTSLKGVAAAALTTDALTTAT